MNLDEMQVHNSLEGIYTEACEKYTNTKQPNRNDSENSDDRANEDQ